VSLSLEVVLAIALGGSAGALLRFWMTHLGNGRAPWGTLTVNLLGSAALGILLNVQGTLPQWLWIGLAAGVCGALTTFSTCMVEAAEWMRAGLFGRAIAYLLATFGGGIGLILLALKMG
tara:strand:- start:86687 stop:87043 length:357 start_codon:yes stop_codon:yes gene_type:complete